jgi:predicted RNA-binding Zn-ribbon protein involved in translation (DUF1610 family)
MPEDQTPYGNTPIRKIEDVEVFYCPDCGKSLIEYNGRILGMRIVCPGCERVIAGWEGELPVVGYWEEEQEDVSGLG